MTPEQVGKLATSILPTYYYINHRDLYNNKKEFSYNFLIYCFLSMKDKINFENEDPKIEEIPYQYQDLAIIFRKKKRSR